MGFYGNQWLNEASFKDKIKKKAIIAKVNLDIKDGSMESAKDTLLKSGIHPNTTDPDYYKLWEKIGIPDKYKKADQKTSEVTNKMKSIVSDESKIIIDKYNKNTVELDKLSKEKGFQFKIGSVSSGNNYDETKKKSVYNTSFVIFKQNDQDGEFAGRMMPIINKIISDLKNSTKLKAVKEIKITDVYYDKYTYSICIEYTI